MADVLDSKTIVTEELHALRDRIIANIDAQRASASGTTARSLRVDMPSNIGRLYGRPYFGVLETGRRAAPLPRGFLAVLAQWAADKGLAFADNPKAIRSIYWSIARRGTKLFRTGGRTNIYSTEIPQTIETIKQRMLAAFVKRITHKSIQINP